LIGLLLIFSLFNSSSDFWNIGETDVYSVPMAMITEKGIVIFDIHGKEVWYFDRGTKGKKRLTQMGQGPHEMSSPNFFPTTDGKSVWIVVLKHKAIEFNHKGEFVKSVQLPFDIGMAYRAKDGWVALSGLTPTSSNKPTCLVFYNDDFSTRREIRCWASEVDRGSSPYSHNLQGLFDPTAESSVLLPFLDGKYLTIHIGKTDTFYVYDSQTLELVLEKQADLPRKTFDRDWGLARLEEQNKVGFPGLKFRPDFPQYFPRIRFVHGTEWGHVRVYPWQIHNKRDQYITYDLEGNEVAESELAQTTYQIVKIEGDLIYFLYLREDESWSIGRLPSGEFLKMSREKPFTIPQ